jgi:hypothetical protein
VFLAFVRSLGAGPIPNDSYVTNNLFVGQAGELQLIVSLFQSTTSNRAYLQSISSGGGKYTVQFLECRVTQ